MDPAPTTVKKYTVSGGTRVLNMLDVDTIYRDVTWHTGHVICLFLCSKARCAMHLEAFHVLVDERPSTFV